MSEHATRTIIYTVTGQHISHDYAAPDAVNESCRYLQAMFSLDETWNGLRIEAIFYNRSVTAEPVPLDESLVCEVPAVVLRKPEREFYCGIVGYGEDGYRLTSDAVGVDLGGAAYTQGRTPAQPEPDLYARILAELSDKLDANQGAENAGKALVIGADGSVVPGEVQGGGGDHPLYLCHLSTTSPFTLDRTYAEVAAASAAGYAVAAMWGKYMFTLRTLSETAAQFACVDLEFRGYGVTLLTFNLPADSQEVGSIYAKVPFAGSTTGGVVCAEPATEADTIPARLGEDGRLYVAASPAPVTSVNGQTGDVKLGMVVTITDNGDGTLTASHIASEIIAHVEAGGTAVAEYNGYTMRYYGADEGAAVFIVDMIITSQVQRESLFVTEDGVAIYFKNIYTPPTPPSMTGATATAAGAPGLVPAPAAGEQDMVLHGDGTWREAAAGGADISLGVTSAEVGDILRVSAVDDNGMPTAWEAVEKNESTVLAEFTLEEDITGYGYVAIPLSDNPFEYTKILITISAKRLADGGGQYQGFLHGGGKAAQVCHLNTLFSDAEVRKVCIMANLFKDYVYSIANKQGDYMWNSDLGYAGEYLMWDESSVAGNIFEIKNSSIAAGATIRIEGVK